MGRNRYVHTHLSFYCVCPMNMQLAHINTMRRILIGYFDAYVEQEENPTIAGALDYATVEEELEDEKAYKNKKNTEFSLSKHI